MYSGNRDIRTSPVTVATVTKKWVRVRESYGIEIATGQDVALLVAVAVAIQSLAR
jgi:uncharacterized protein YxjI